MELFFAPACGVLLAAAVYLLLSHNLMRIVLGLLLLSNGVNLSLYVAGRMGRVIPPILQEGQAASTAMANPLPQALILTAIVISFALMLFTAVLFERAYRALATLDTNSMREVEPVASTGSRREAA